MADTRTKSDSNLGRKGQAVADTRINRLTRWLTDSVNHLFCEENMENMENFEVYRNPNYTEKIKLQRFFTQLQIAASFFKEHFVGKIMYYETEIESVELHFSPTNFMHLCGVDYRKGAGSFFDDCLNRHVIIDELKIKKDGTTMQKLQVLGSIEELLGKHVHLTGSGRYLYLEFDYALRTRKQILALTLKETSRKIVPQSLLDLKRKTVFPKGEKVISIYSKHVQTSELFYYLKD